MNFKAVSILLLLLIGIYTTYGQEQPIDGQSAGDPQQINQQQFETMRRTACLVLSRYHSNTQKQTLQNVIKGLSPQNQQKYINKIYAVAVQKCQASITESEVGEMYTQQQNFDPTHLFYHFREVDYASLVNSIDTFSQNEQNIVKYMKKFDEEMQIKRQQQQAQKNKQQGQDSRYQMKLFGFSFHNISSQTKIIYLIIFGSIIVGIIIYLFSQLNTKKQKVPNKRRKSTSPKKKQQ